MSVHAFQQQLSSKAGAPDPEMQELLAGFPPKVLQLPENRHTSTISSLQIQNGDTVTVRQLTCAAATSIQRPSPGTAPTPATVQPAAALMAAAAHLSASSSAAGVDQHSRAIASTVSSADQQQRGWAAPPAEYDEDAALAQALAMSMTEQEEAVGKLRSAEQQEQERQKELQDQQQHHREKMQEHHAQQAQAHHQQQQKVQHEREQRQQQDQQQRDQQRAQQQERLGSVSSQVVNASGNGNSIPQRSAAAGNGIPAKTAAVSGKNQAAPVSMSLADGSIVIRRIIDSDNSCLFNAVGYVMEHTRSRAEVLRGVIADAVSADPDTYNEGFLEKPNVEYCQWIVQKNKWGGAIELSILAAHYGRQIAAYDIQTMRCDVYGQDAGYSEQVMLLYDGLHYDALAVSAFEGAPEAYDITIFEPDSIQGKGISAGAQALVSAAHSARQFTDTNSFTLRCGACQIGLKGEKEAVEHAKSTDC